MICLFSVFKKQHGMIVLNIHKVEHGSFFIPSGINGHLSSDKIIKSFSYII